MFSGGVVEKGYTRNEWVNLTENIVCGFQMTHLDQMKLAEKKNRCGRPLMKATDKKNKKIYNDFTLHRRTGNFFNWDCSRKSLSRTR